MHIYEANIDTTYTNAITSANGSISYLIYLVHTNTASEYRKYMTNMNIIRIWTCTIKDADTKHA